MAARIGPGSVFHLNVCPDTLLQVPADDLLALLLPGDAGIHYSLDVSQALLIRDLAALAERLGLLREHGVSLTIDDVRGLDGTLPAMLDLQPATIKLDPWIVQGVADAPQNRRTISRITRLAGRMGIDAVAEGVESARDARCLAELGIRHAQGFLYGQPVAAG